MTETQEVSLCSSSTAILDQLNTVQNAVNGTDPHSGQNLQVLFAIVSI